MRGPRTELLAHTHRRLSERWRTMTDEQRDRYALIAQQWRELKGELDAQERQFMLDCDLFVQIPHLADGQHDSSAALAPAYGEPSTSEDGTHRNAGRYDRKASR